jgi:hypothetical protein
MSKAALEVADIFRRHGEAFRARHPTSRQRRRVMQAIEECRTAKVGGHLYECDNCAHRIPVYNSCRNRHCPKCQSLAKAKWLEAREAELLPVKYFHVVFTVPDYLAVMALQNARVFYGLMFRAVSYTLLKIAADPRHLGADIGFFAVLHTWGQTLQPHPHLHCVVPGGGLSSDRQQWKACRGEKFFLPVKVLSSVFRGAFIDFLKQAYGKGKLEFHGRLASLREPREFQKLLSKSCQTDWVVYAKQPFGGPQQVLNYLGRYTHRVAISNHRLLKLEEGKVTFSWRDYRDGNTPKEMTLEAEEFIRRFLLHVLPDGFQRIRYFGLMANRGRAQNLALCRRLLGAEEVKAGETAAKDWRTLYEEMTGHDVSLCPSCANGRLVQVERLLPEQGDGSCIHDTS